MKRMVHLATLALLGASVTAGQVPTPLRLGPIQGRIQPGAMPPSNRYLGNPVLSGVGRMFFGAKLGDFHCGLRGFSKAAVLKMDRKTTGMEFASELVVKASLAGAIFGNILL